MGNDNKYKDDRWSKSYKAGDNTQEFEKALRESTNVCQEPKHLKVYKMSLATKIKYWILFDLLTTITNIRIIISFFLGFLIAWGLK